jgi:cyclomaltodextrinase / maltogenic alpha-amylase / neopullulanase
MNYLVRNTPYLMLSLACCLYGCAAQSSAPAVSSANTQVSYANVYDKALEKTLAAREQDWRNGAVVYQILVDRFAPSTRLEQKRALYPAPKILRNWNEVPQRGTYLEKEKLWSHEIDFWGGDLQSLTSKLDYVKSLDVDVLYLNPIHLGYTNHKYDALDYKQVSPEYGTREDVKTLAATVHKQGMKLVLDGVFNHMGRNSELFNKAESDVNSPYRNWFNFGKQYPGGVRSWWGAQNVPELNLENPAVREYIYGGKDSVVQGYLSDGIDGWRLDVAYDLGFNYLQELTEAAHTAKPGSLVVGELATYPKEWFPSVDAVMNLTLYNLIIRTVKGKLDAKTASQMLDRVIADAGIDNMLKSWLLLDNHDIPRLHTELPHENQRKLAQVLQFTLPGSPNLYYGTEVGMTGTEDPEMRGPMRWDLVQAKHPDIAWTKQLVSLHKRERALRIGNFRVITANKLFAFERYTDRAEDTVLIIANPTDTEVSESVMVANTKLMDGSIYRNLMNTSEASHSMRGAFIDVTLAANAVLVLKPNIQVKDGYSNFKRVQ